MTWALPADQRRLLDIFGSQPGALDDAREFTPSHEFRQSGADLLLLWADDPRHDRSPGRSGSLHPVGRESDEQRCVAETGFPEAIIVRSGGMREFLAWATTVVGSFRPFTAFFKVMAHSHLELALVPRTPTLGTVEDALVGLIIGETLAQSASQCSLAGVSLLACESTYSFAFARAWALGFRNSASFDPVGEPWALARKLTRQPTRKLGDDLIQPALGVVASIAGVSSKAFRNGRTLAFIREACGELHRRGKVMTSWPLLGDAFSRLGEDMQGPREQRVRTFERVVGATTNMDPITGAFITALLADQIGPGTFEHVELLVPYLQERPMVAVWYGLCAGLHSQSEVQQVGNCLGRRIARDLLAPDPIASRPKYDISVHELEVCLDREVPVDFRTASQNHMAIELLPGVPAFVKWPVKEGRLPAEGAPFGAAPSTTLGHQRELFADDSDVDLFSEGQAALADIESATARAKAVFAELSRRGVGKGRSHDGERRRRARRR